MSLKVQENRLVAVNRLGENTLQTVLQGKVELPSNAAPVERIVWVKGSPVIQSVTTDQDRVYVQGVVDLSLVYVPETLEGEPAGLRRVEWPGALPFDHYVEVIGAEPGMVSKASSTILVCEWELQSGQYSVDVDVILSTTAQVEQVQKFTVISDVNYSKPVKLNADGLLVNPVIPALQLKAEKEVTGLLELPEDEEPAQTVLDTDVQLNITKRELTKGKLLLAGTASLFILYEGKEYNVREQVFLDVLPFELTFEQREITEQMQVKECLHAVCQAFTVNEGKDFRAELEIKGVVTLKEQKPTRVLTAITTPGDQVAVRTEVIGLDSFVAAKEERAAAKGLVDIGQRLPPIREILRSRSQAHVTDYEVEEDKITIEGVCDVELYYLAHSEEDTKPLVRAVFTEALNFQQTVVVSGLEPGMQPDIRLQVMEVQPDLINRETIEVSVLLKVAVDALEYLELEVVVEAVAIEPPVEDPPTLTYIFVQPGDTVWKLARQYHTSEEVVLEANPSLQNNPELLKVGDRLLIPRA